jgi:hypothetical protein
MFFWCLLLQRGSNNVIKPVNVSENYALANRRVSFEISPLMYRKISGPTL